MGGIPFFLLLVCIGASSAAFGQGAKPQAADAPKPNILLIVTDDQGYGDLGVHGNPVLRTPVLDRLAGESVTFSRYYVAPVCAPTRAGLMTGRHYLRTGVYNTRFGGDTLDEREITLPQLLKAAGYRTGLFGKWHLGPQPKDQPQHRGFDEFLGFVHGHAEHYDYPTQLLHNGEPVAARGYLTDLFTDAAINFIQAAPGAANSGGPFFCYLAYNVPHSPFLVGSAHAQDEEGAKLLAHYLELGVPLREARIYSMIERADGQIGRLLAAIDDVKLRERTIVLFMSDNGGIHRHYTAGLRGGKASVYEGGVRSPLLVRWPGRFRPAHADGMASHIDIMPTLCELAGVPLPGSIPGVDGRSLVPLLTGEAGDSPHLWVYHTWNRHVPDPDKNWAIGNQRWKLANGQLFDLQNDPGEKMNLAADEPRRVEQMRAEYLRWFSEVTAGRTFEPAPIEVGGPHSAEAELQASWAKISGGLRYEFRAYDWDTIEDWAGGASASWRLDVKTAGRYELIASYASGRQSPPAVVRFSVAGGAADAERHVLMQAEPTPSADVFIRRSIGVINLPQGKLELKAQLSGGGGGEGFALNRLWLKRLENQP